MKNLVLLSVILVAVHTSLGGSSVKTNTKYSWPYKKQCSRDSPGTMYNMEVVPWLNQVLDELDIMSDRLINNINEGVAFLEYHVDRSPMTEMDRNEYFDSVIETIRRFLRTVMDDIADSWSALQAASEHYEEQLAPLANSYACVFGMRWNKQYHPYEEVFSDLHRAVDGATGTYLNSTSIVRGVLRELAVTTKAIALNSITTVMETLDLAGLEREDASRLLHNNIDRIAPNFLGLLMKKMLKIGEDGKNKAPMNLDPLAVLGDVHFKMSGEVSELEDHCYPCGAMKMIYRHYWRSQVQGSTVRVKRRPKYPEDYVSAYYSDEFLSEATLGLMMSFNFNEEAQ